MGVIIGDIVHNLRSALDQLVWSLTIKYQTDTGQPPPFDPIPSGSPWRRVQFPVTTKSESWPDFVRNNLWGISPSLVTRFKSLQPFNSRDDPARHPVAVLQELWNADKHRAVHLVASFVELERVGERPPNWEPGLPEFRTNILKRRHSGPFEDGTEIAVVEILDWAMPMKQVAEAMHLNFHFAYEVAFEEGPPAYGGGVMQTLQALYQIVRGVLTDFEPEFSRPS